VGVVERRAVNSILVTATREGVGKTGIALGLALEASERGRSVGYMKPKGTRLQSYGGGIVDTDPMLARELLGLDAAVEEMVPIVYSATFVGQAIRDGTEPTEIHRLVRDRFRTLADGHDLMVIEGGGSLTTGGTIALTDVDVAELLDAEVLLVTPYERPEDVDGILAATDRIGDRLAGILFNPVADEQFDYLQESVIPFLEARGLPVLGVLPRVKELAGVTVAELVDHLNAEQLTDSGEGATVERFLVGAMTSESALRYFRRTRDTAVITGGDRADLQSVALETSGVTCLILTGGFAPSDAILGKAEATNVPVLLVRTDALATVERAEEIVRSGRVRDEHTVRVVRDLLTDHADVDAILGEPDC
jgi:hypothetical protein